MGMVGRWQTMNAGRRWTSEEADRVMREILLIAAAVTLALAVLAGIVAGAGRRRWRTLTGGLSSLCLVVAVAALVMLAAPFTPTMPHALLTTPPYGRPAPVQATAAVYVSGWSCHDLNAAPNGCDKGQSLVALSGRDGTVRWKYPAPGQLGDIATGPLLYDGVLYVYSQDDEMGHGELSAVRASDGKTLWRVSFPYYAEMLEGMGDTLYVFTANPDYQKDYQNLKFGWMVVTLNVQDGTIQRTVLLPTEVDNDAHLALDGDLLYTCDTGKNVKAIQVSDGTLLWQSAYGTSAASADPCTVAASSGVVYVSPAHGDMLLALRASVGTLLWQIHGSYLREVATATNGVAYVIQLGPSKFGSPCNPECPVITTPDTLFAIRVRDGKMLWQRQFANGIIHRGMLVGDILYLSGGALTAVRVSDGKMLWQVKNKGDTYLVYDAQPGVVFAEALVSPVVLRTGTATAYGFPVAVDARDGSPFWQGSVLMGVVNEMAVSA